VTAADFPSNFRGHWLIVTSGTRHGSFYGLSSWHGRLSATMNISVNTGVARKINTNNIESKDIENGWKVTRNSVFIIAVFLLL
jgi:hypothetical protein